MNAFVLYPFVAVAGYLIGSIPFAVLIAKSRGIDIFSVGSGNPGATNVMRAVGKSYGYGCFLLDALKGVTAVLIGQGLALQGGPSMQAAGIVALLGAILGHSFSIFLKLRGGKGVATTVGGLLALMPPVLLIGALVWLVVFFAFRYVSLASLLLGISLPVSAFFLRMDRLEIGFCLALSVLIVVRHRSNIQRLLAGTENKAGSKKS